MRSTEEIFGEIEDRLGFVPTFFHPAASAPELLESLWRQTLAAYVQNPLPALFKEKLFAHLSRYCSVPYCIVCHSCALRPLGLPAAEILALLDWPGPTHADLDQALGQLANQAVPLAGWPEPSEPLEAALLIGAIWLFTRPDQADACREEMRRVLGEPWYTRLAGFLGYVRSCHLWVETHPELAFHGDARAKEHLTPLLEEEPGLEEFFRSYGERVRLQTEGREQQLQRENAERRRAEEELLRTRDLLQTVIDGTSDPVFVKDRNGRCLLLNAAAAAVFARPADQVLGRLDHELFPADTAAAIRRLDNEILRTGEVRTFEETVPTPERTRHYSTTKGPVRDHTGEVIGIYGVARDITRQKEVEQDLRYQLELTRTITENATAALFMMDAQGRCTFMNPAAEAMTGYRLDEIRDMPLHDAIHHTYPDGRSYPMEECPIDRALPEKNQVRGHQDLFIRKDGTFFPVLVAAEPIIRDGEPVGTVIEVRDIAEEIRAEEQLREEARTIETINRVGQALAAELDLDRLVQAVTDAGTELSGAEFGAFFYNILNEEGEAYLLYALSGVPREAFARFPMPRNTPIFAPTFVGEAVVRLDDVTRDPRYGNVPPHYGMPEGHLPVCSYLALPVVSRSGEVIGALFFGHSRPGVFTARHERILLAVAAQAAVAIDNARLYQKAQREIERRERVETALRHSEERLRAIVEHSPAIIFLKDLDGRYLLMNQHGHTLLADQPLASVLGKTDYELFPKEIADYLRENDRLVLEAGEPLRFEEWSQSSGRYITQKFVLRDAGGVPYAVGGISTDVTELSRLQEELRQRVQDLAEADRSKDEFLAMLAHELRNPLAPVMNAIQVLQARSTEDPLVQRQRAVIDRQTRHMARLLDDLLDVSRITRGKIELQRQPLELGAAVDQAVEAVRPLIEQRQHELTVTVPREPLYVNADPTRLHQILANLLNNAAKYTDPSGRITLVAERDPDSAVIRVTDTGVGIEPEFLPRVFDLFAQADRSLSRPESGLGIGLTMVHRLVQLHGGTVTAHSDGAGKGTRFTVRLPLLTVHPTTQEPARSATPSARALLGRRILVVDDNRDAAETLADLAETWGHQARTAHDGHNGVQAALEYRPEIILLDISMPGMNGYEVAQALRLIPELNGLVLIALTGYGQEEDRQRALAAGFDHHLTKPVDPDALYRILAEPVSG